MGEKALPIPGDPCPQCGGAFVEARQLTADERAAALDRESPTVIQGFADTATPAVIAKHGPLAKCGSCGYQTRFAPADIERARAAAAEARGEVSGPPSAPTE